MRGRLVVRSDAAEGARLEVPLSMRTTGALLRFDKPLRDFGAFPVGFATPPLDVSLTNAGDTAASVDVSAAPPFSVEWTKSGPLAPGATRTGRARFKPAALGATSSVWSATAGVGLCEVPTMLALGRGVDGVVGVTPGALDFGDLDCATSRTESVFVSNVSATPFEVTVALQRPDTRYEPLVVVDTAPPGGALEVPARVTALAYAGTSPLPYDDVLRIRTDAPNDPVHDVALTMRPRGAVLRFDAPYVDLGVARLDLPPSTLPITVHNDGNVPVTVGLQLAPPLAVPPSVTVPAGGSQVVPVDPGDSGNLPGAVREPLALTVSQPLCSPKPFVEVGVRYADRVRKIASGRGGIRAAIAESGHVYTFYKGGTAYRMGGLSGVTAELAGYEGSICARLTSGAVKCWGAGILGTGAYGGSSTPVDVLGITDATSIGAGSGAACAVLSTGRVRCWGQNTGCLFGSCNFVSTLTPLELPGLSSVVQIAPAASRHCARLAGGTVMCWGRDMYAAPDPPTAVAGLPPATFVATGFQRQCAIDAMNQAWCWDERPGMGSGPPTVMSGGTLIEKIACADKESIYGQSATWAQGPQALMGWNVYPVVMPTTFPMALRDMSAMAGLCVVRADGRVACTADNGFQNPPPLVDVPGFD